MGPQPDRAKGPEVVSDAAGSRGLHPSRAKPSADARHAADALVPGLAARTAAAKLLAVVIDTNTPLDGLTDNEHGHPQYRALDMRDRGVTVGGLALAVHPVAAFLRNYVLRGGFSEGRAGLAVSLLNSYYVLLKHVKLLELQESGRAPDRK